MNVSTGDWFTAGQIRLESEIRNHDLESSLYFRSSIPSTWPSHESNPYAFKAFALVEASAQYSMLLWCDSSIVPLRSLEPMWEAIQRDGYWIASDNNYTNYQCTADSAYPELFPGMDIDKAREINKTIPQVIATVFGLDVSSHIGKEFLSEYYRIAKSGAFRGPWANANNPLAKDWYAPGTSKPCGPPDVFCHRHDQTAASVLAWRLGMKMGSDEIFYGDKKILLIDRDHLWRKHETSTFDSNATR